MQILFLVLVLFSNGLFILNRFQDFLGTSSFLYSWFAITFFGLTFLLSFFFLFIRQWIFLFIHIAVLGLVVMVPENDETDVNFQEYKEQREELIEMLASDEIEKEPDRYGNSGFFFYYTPEGYEMAVRSDTIHAAKHSDEELYVFFQSADIPILRFEGLQEGFVYSSRGEFPSAEKFDSFYYGYKKIDDHWYFVSDDPKRLEANCQYYCGEVVQE